MIIDAQTYSVNITEGTLHFHRKSITKKTQVKGYHIHFKIDYRQSVHKEHTFNEHHRRRMLKFLKQIGL